MTNNPQRIHFGWKRYHVLDIFSQNVFDAKTGSIIYDFESLDLDFLYNIYLTKHMTLFSTSHNLTIITSLSTLTLAWTKLFLENDPLSMGYTVFPKSRSYDDDVISYYEISLNGGKTPRNTIISEI